MPALSPTMEAGNIATWIKKEGDEVSAGEALCDVETDKAVVAFESTEDGYLAKILVPDGSQDVVVGTPVAIMVEEEADIAAFKDYTPDAAPAAEPAAAAEPTPAAAPPTPTPAAPAAAAPVTPSPSSSSAGARVIASPLARKTALEKGVPLEQIQGTGPNHRIIQADVLEFQPSAVAAAAAAVATPVPPAAAPAQPTLGTAGTDFEDIPHTNMRRVIADRLQKSKQEAPHYYLTSDIRMDVALKLRKALNEIQAKNGLPKISVNDLVVKAAALACLKVPEVNSAWQEGAIRKYNFVDVSVAVSTPTGLITPIVKDADIKGLGSIAADVRDLATRGMYLPSFLPPVLFLPSLALHLIFTWDDLPEVMSSLISFS